MTSTTGPTGVSFMTFPTCMQVVHGISRTWHGSPSSHKIGAPRTCSPFPRLRLVENIANLLTFAPLCLSHSMSDAALPSLRQAEEALTPRRSSATGNTRRALPPLHPAEQALTPRRGTASGATYDAKKNCF